MALTRISPDDARRLVDAGEASLVCAYRDEEKCRNLRLEGAQTLEEFKSRGGSKTAKVIFY